MTKPSLTTWTRTKNQYSEHFCYHWCFILYKGRLLLICGILTIIQNDTKIWNILQYFSWKYIPASHDGLGSRFKCLRMPGVLKSLWRASRVNANWNDPLAFFNGSKASIWFSLQWTSTVDMAWFLTLLWFKILTNVRDSVGWNIFCPTTIQLMRWQNLENICVSALHQTWWCYTKL